MITMFNRREIMVTRKSNVLNTICNKLINNNILYTTRTNSMTNPGRSHGIPNIRADFAYEYRIYVHRKDYERAKSIIY